MSDFPPGTWPVVFESGVVRFDEDGGLHVHLTHSADAPHPVAAQPDGSDGTVPAAVGEISLSGAGKGSVLGSFLETETLPEGFVAHFTGYEMVKLEASGDLTVVIKDVESAPSWFTPGKVHRFDGPDGPVRLWSESAPVPKPKRKAPPPAAPPRPKAQEAASAGKGCLVLIAAGSALAMAAGWLAA